MDLWDTINENEKESLDYLCDNKASSDNRNFKNINHGLTLVKLSRDELIAFARQYINKSDALYPIANSIQPIEGFEDFIIHGKPNVVEYETTNGQWIQLTPEDFAESLKSDKEYHGGNIRLLSCKSGMLNNGFAQQLANLMGVKVMAPTETLWIKQNGEMFIADNEVLADLWDSGENVHPTGVWKIFVPQKGN